MSAASGEQGVAGRRNWRLISAAIAAAVLAVFIAANAHFIYVAFSSQPDCVAHAKEATDGGALRAAESSC
ncbi:MAG: hypothetical protein J0I98_18225 [Mesorhizobium sp.]|nr:hypothetical protein [Mesorhizobium sp.]MBN9244725.1 hypothetical protein [Mesorhizobium sp.]